MRKSIVSRSGSGAVRHLSGTQEEVRPMSVLQAIRSAAPGTVVHDRGEAASVEGLSLRTTKRSKTWFLFYRAPGHSGDAARRRPAIGKFPSISLNDARKIAKGLLVRVARGEDPSAEKQAARAELTVDELWEQALARYYRPKGSAWAREVEGLWELWLSKPFGKMKISELRPTHVREWHAAVSQSQPARANRALAVLKKVFAWAELMELVPLGASPAKPVGRALELARSRYASDQEIRDIVALLHSRADEDPRGVAFVSCLMLTGSRPKFLLQAEWGDLQVLDVRGERVGLLARPGKSTSKTGRKEQVVLPPKALELVEALPRDPDDPRIFRLAEVPRKLWEDCKAAAGAVDLRARDLRRTFATIGFSGGLNKGLVGELLNHSCPATTDVYAKLVVQARADGAMLVHQKIQQILENKKTAPEGAAPDASK